EMAENIFRQFMGGMDLGGGAGEQFGRQRRSTRQRRPAAEPQEAEVTIPFLTAALGGTVSLRIDGREVEVRIPAGVGEGETLRLSGPPAGGGQLLYTIRVQPHQNFRRGGHAVPLDVDNATGER